MKADAKLTKRIDDLLTKMLGSPNRQKSKSAKASSSKVNQPPKVATPKEGKTSTGKFSIESAVKYVSKLRFYLKAQQNNG